MRRGAIVGAGNVAAQGHAPAWATRPDIAIVAGCDPRPERRGELTRSLPGLSWHDSIESLLGSERLDFVDVCTPPAAHAPAIRAALGAGTHVLCEKPLVLDPGELAELSDLARRQDRVLATVHNWRYAPPIARAGEILRSGAIGTPRRCRWEVHRDRPSVAVGGPDSIAGNWRLDPALSGGGILTDHGWHAIYVLAEWLGAPGPVWANLTSDGEPDAVAEDTARVEIRFPGAIAEIFLTWKALERRNRIEIDGSRGRLTIDGRTLRLESGSRPAEQYDFPEALSEGSHHPDWFGRVAERFLAEIRDRDRRGETLAEAAICLNVLRAARESAKERSSGIPPSARAEAASGRGRR